MTPLELLHVIILGLVQGLTEFLPVSSSGHLILLPRIFGWPDQGLAQDVAAHMGTLAAVALYFRADLRGMAAALRRGRHESLDAERRMFLNLCVATLPVVVVGLLLRDLVATALRDPLVIAATTPGFGLVLLWADRRGRRRRGDSSIGWRDAACIGAAQCLALIPGTSRSGITITAGLFLDLERRTAARFSFLLSVPTLLLAGLYEFAHLYFAGEPAPWKAMGVVALVSGASGWLTIHYFLRFLGRYGMLPFVLYRLALGSVLFVLFV